VLLTPPAAMTLRFGEPSFANHLAAARALHLEPAVVPVPGLGLDVDDPDDLETLLVAGPATESARLVAGWRLASRAAGPLR
jgi:2-phospho-L-lactate guanylyltransferase